MLKPPLLRAHKLYIASKHIKCLRENVGTGVPKEQIAGLNSELSKMYLYFNSVVHYPVFKFNLFKTCH